MKILFATTAHIEDLGVLVYVCKSFHTRIGLSKVATTMWMIMTMYSDRSQKECTARRVEEDVMTL